MKKPILILIAAGSCLLTGAQQPPSPPANMQTTPSADVPRNPESDNVPPERAFNPTNPPAGRPFRQPNQDGMVNNPMNSSNAPDGSGIPASADLTASGSSATNTTGMSSTNSFNASITNTLRSMSPEQANNVIQVQANLTAIQNLNINIKGVQNVQQAIQQNPQAQQQLQQMSTRITALARGPVQPSPEIVQRLSLDLCRAIVPARVPADRLLVVAVIINQACNSANMTTAQIDEALNTGLTALRSAGVPLASAHPVSCDLHSIAYELQPNLGL